MDQQLRCTVDHDFQTIIGICTNEQCQADTRIVCMICLQNIHVECQNQFCQTQEFIMRLADLKQKIQQDNDVILNCDKVNQINLIDQILNKQNILSVKDWEQGYEMLSKKVGVVPQRTFTLIEKLNQTKQQIDQIAIAQSKQSIQLLQPQSIVKQSADQTNKPILQQNTVVKELLNQIGYIQSNEQNNQISQTSVQQLINSNWNTITKQNPLIIEAKYRVLTIALSPDGKYIASAGSSNHQIKIWNPITGSQVGNGMNGHKDNVSSINYSKCGNYIVSGSYDETIRQWNVQSQSQIGEAMIGHDNWVLGVQYTIDQKYIVSCSEDATVRIWEPKSGKEFVNKRIKHANSIWCMALSPIQSDVVFGDDEGIMKIWDYESTKQSGQLKLHSAWIRSVQYSNNGKFIISGSDDMTIILWDAMSKRKIRSYIGHTDFVQSVCFSSNMKYLISGGWDGTVRLWNSMIGRQIGEALLNHEKAQVNSTQFSLDAKYIITGGYDHRIKIMVAPIDQ